MTMKKILLAALLGGFFMSASAADPDEPPEGMYQQPVRLLLNCFDSFARVVEALLQLSWFPRHTRTQRRRVFFGQGHQKIIQGCQCP